MFIALFYLPQRWFIVKLLKFNRFRLRASIVFTLPIAIVKQYDRCGNNPLSVLILPDLSDVINNNNNNIHSNIIDSYKKIKIKQYINIVT